MFTQSCYIEKNTLELRNKLEELGYKYGGKERTYGDAKALYCRFDRFYECVQTPSRYESIVNCKDNEELFLAITALSYDTDKYQWFFSTGWTDFEGNPLPDKWVLCDQDTLEKFAFVNNSPNSYKTGWKKANVQELINHFKL